MLAVATVYLSKAWRKVLPRCCSEEEQANAVAAQLKTAFSKSIESAVIAVVPILRDPSAPRSYYTPNFGSPAWEWWDRVACHVDLPDGVELVQLASLLEARLPENTHVELSNNHEKDAK